MLVDGHIYRYKDLKGKRGIEASQDKYIYIYIYIGVEKVEVASLISILLNLLQKLKVMTYKGRLKI